MMYKTHAVSPVGKLLLASDGTNLTGLWLENQKYYAATMAADAVEKKLPIFDETKEWLAAYFAGHQPPLNLPLAPAGSSFRQAVFKILREIPYGQLTTYREIAAKIAKENGISSMSAQAVGGAVGHNPISIIIPCHRVVGSNGSLTGFAGGISKKIYLLKLEGIDANAITIPTKGTAL